MHFVLQELDLIEYFLALSEHIAALFAPYDLILLVNFESGDEEQGSKQEKGRDQSDKYDEEDEQYVGENRRLHSYVRVANRLAKLALHYYRPV